MEKWKSVKAWVDQPSNRRKVLLSTVVISVAVTVLREILMRQPMMGWASDLIQQSSFNGDVFFPSQPPAWKDKLTALVPVVGLPVAFWLWHWRDKNVQDQIENSRKDVNLKEFQVVQLRAAGALGEEISDEASVQLQIASLQQLRGFIRGDYGESFRRPAFELLLSGHAWAMEKLGTRAVSRWVRTDGLCSSNVRQTIEEAISQLRDNLDSVARERMWIIKDDWEILVSTGFPLHHRNFDLIDLQGKSFDGLTLYHSSFVGAWLAQSNFRESSIWTSDFIGANMIGCEFSGATLSSCHCEGTNFSMSKFSGATAHSTYFKGAILESCDMKTTFVEKADFEQAVMNGLELCEEDEKYFNPKFFETTVSGLMNMDLESIAKTGKPSREERDQIEELTRNSVMPNDYDDAKIAEVWAKLVERGARKPYWMS